MTGDSGGASPRRRHPFGQLLALGVVGCASQAHSPGLDLPCIFSQVPQFTFPLTVLPSPACFLTDRKRAHSFCSTHYWEVKGGRSSLSPSVLLVHVHVNGKPEGVRIADAFPLPPGPVEVECPFLLHILFTDLRISQPALQ